MSFRTAYLTPRETNIWSIRRDEKNKSEIGRHLGVSRQAIHISLSLIDTKIKKAFTEACESNKLEPRSINVKEGIMKAYSPAYGLPVVLSLTRVNGLQVWYLYERNCANCVRNTACRAMLLNEVEERKIVLTGEELEMAPTHLARAMFGRLTEDKMNAST